MRRTIKFRKKRIPERDVYDPITASYYYTTISDRKLLKAAFEVPEQEHSWFDIVDSFLGRTSKYIEKVKWW